MARNREIRCSFFLFFAGVGGEAGLMDRWVDQGRIGEIKHVSFIIVKRK